MSLKAHLDKAYLKTKKEEAFLLGFSKVIDEAVATKDLKMLQVVADVIKLLMERKGKPSEQPKP